MQGPLLGEVAAQASREGPGGRLLRLLDGLPLEGLERSIKFTGAGVLDQRYLVGIHKSGISPARLFAVCDAMGMPEKFRDAFRSRAEGANAFHFGFEGSEGGGLFKVYLEFAQGLSGGASAPFALHVAYKWDCLDPRKATVATYTCHPGLGVEDVLARLAALGAPGAVGAIVRTAALRAGEPPMYLEVAEEGNPRASYDLNLHAAGMRIADVRDELREACRAGSVLDAVQDRVIGHLSGGTSRDGRDFLTVYYAVESL